MERWLKVDLQILKVLRIYHDFRLPFINFSNFLNYQVSNNIFWPRSADPDACEVIDCTHDGAKDACPQKCTEDDICKMADCSEPEATTYCPITCGESKSGTKGKEKILYCKISTTSL